MFIQVTKSKDYDREKWFKDRLKEIEANDWKTLQSVTHLSKDQILRYVDYLKYKSPNDYDRETEDILETVVQEWRVSNKYGTPYILNTDRIDGVVGRAEHPGEIIVWMAGWVDGLPVYGTLKDIYRVLM